MRARTGTLPALMLGLVTLALVLAAALLTSPRTSLAESPRVHARIAAVMLLKVLGYDYNLRERCGGSVALAVVYIEPEAKARARSVAAELEEHRADGVRIKGMPLSHRTVRFDARTFRGLLRKYEIAAVYVVTTGHAPPERLAQLSEACRLERAVSFSDDGELVGRDFPLSVRDADGSLRRVARCLSIGVETHAGKPRLVLDRRNAEGEGASFSSQLLKLCRLVGDDGD